MAKRKPIGRANLQFMARTIAGVKASAFPLFIEPCLATLRPAPPSGQKWQFEFKLDGYRMQIHARRRTVKIYSRNGLDWADKLPSIVAAAKTLPSPAVLDGEIIVQNAKGLPDFQLLRSALEGAPGQILFYAFDLLHLDGFDLRSAALVDRRRVLDQFIASIPRGRILMSEAMDGSGDDLFKHAAELGIEGIVAKRIDCPYRSGRVETWIKVKALRAMQLAIIGFVPAAGNSIAALRLGRRENGGLVYAGKVGTGFTAKSAQSVRARLEPLIRSTAPLAKPLRKKGTIWVEPKLEAEVHALDFTDDGMVRHGSFKGLRP